MTVSDRDGACAGGGAVCGPSWALPSVRSRWRAPGRIVLWRSVGMVPVLFAWITWRSGGHPFRQVRKVGRGGGDRRAGAGAWPLPGRSLRSRRRPSPMRYSCSPPRPFSRPCWAGWSCANRCGRATWIAIGVAGLGMFVMVREGLAAGAMAGNLSALGSALGFAAFTITLRWGKLDDMMPAVMLGGIFAIASGRAGAGGPGRDDVGAAARHRGGDDDGRGPAGDRAWCCTRWAAGWCRRRN